MFKRYTGNPQNEDEDEDAYLDSDTEDEPRERTARNTIHRWLNFLLQRIKAISDLREGTTMGSALRSRPLKINIMQSPSLPQPTRQATLDSILKALRLGDDIQELKDLIGSSDRPEVKEALHPNWDEMFRGKVHCECVLALELSKVGFMLLIIFSPLTRTIFRIRWVPVRTARESVSLGCAVFSAA